MVRSNTWESGEVLIVERVALNAAGNFAEREAEVYTVHPYINRVPGLCRAEWPLRTGDEILKAI